VHPVLSLCHGAHGQRYGAVLSGRLTTVDVSCEWSTGSALHSSRLSTRLAGRDGAVYPHVLHAIMAQVLDALKTCECALETCKPSCIGRPDMPFFIHEARDAFFTVGHVAASESSLAGMRGPKP
jgi:hypothetical protein